jgi:DNA (cytosine-5)-methyltransferase 1
MQPPKKTHAGFCEGGGGFSIAAKNNGYTTELWVECDPFCRKVLQYHFPNAQNRDYVQNHSYKEFAGLIDLFTAGFPCQPFSLAGQRTGTQHDSFLWPEILRAIREIRPRKLILENVAGLLTILEPESITKVEHEAYQLFSEGNKTQAVITAIESIEQRIIGRIINDLQTAGYLLPKLTDGSAAIGCIPACAINAPHRRDRLWIAAYRNDTGNNSPSSETNGNGKAKGRKGHQPQPEPGRHGGAEIDANTNSNIGRRKERQFSAQQKQRRHLQSLPANTATAIANTHSNGQQHRRPEEGGCSQGQTESEKDKWQRIWAIAGGIGPKEFIAYANRGGSIGEANDSGGEKENAERAKLQQHTNGLSSQPTTPNASGSGRPQTNGAGKPAEHDKDGEADAEFSAYAGGQGLQWQEWTKQEPEKGQSTRQRSEYDIENAGETYSDTSGSEPQGGKKNQQEHAGLTESAGLYRTDFTGWPTQSPLCFRDDGLSTRLDTAALLNGRKPRSPYHAWNKWRSESLKMAGNAIVPANADVLIQIMDMVDELIFETE